MAGMLIKVTKIVLIRSQSEPDLVNIWVNVPPVGSIAPSLNIAVQEGEGENYIKQMGVTEYEIVDVRNEVAVQRCVA